MTFDDNDKRFYRQKVLTRKGTLRIDYHKEIATLGFCQ